MRPIRIALALGVGGIGWWWLLAPAEPVAATARPRHMAPARPLQPALATLLPRSRLIASHAEGHVHDLFAVHSESSPSPALPPAAESETPSLPAAPALPFIYLGKKFEGGQWEVFLVNGDKTLVAREGSLVDDLYRVEAIAPPELRLTYLPLGTRQALSIGEAP